MQSNNKKQSNTDKWATNDHSDVRKYQSESNDVNSKQEQRGIYSPKISKPPEQPKIVKKTSDL